MVGVAPAIVVEATPESLGEWLAGLTDLDQAGRKKTAREVVASLVDRSAADRQTWRDALTTHCGLTGREFEELYREARADRVRLVEGGQGGEPDDGSPAGSRKVPGMPQWRYVPAGRQGAGLWQSVRDSQWVRALDWAPEVLERLVMLGGDGKPSALHYLVRVGPDELVVTHESVRKGEAWDLFPDAYGVASRSIREVVANVVTHQARRLVRTTVVDRTGGHVIDGQRVYVRPDGRTVPDRAAVRIVGVAAELAKLAGPAEREATPAEIAAAVLEVCRRGWSPLLAMGIGARTTGWSIRPVRAGFMVAGPPGGGKSLTQGMARWMYLDMQWPPLASVSFNASVTEIEFAVATEADFPASMEDLALPANAHTGEIRQATEKIEKTFRALANDTEIRGRRNKDLTKKPGNKIRTILGANMQKVPHTVQESLYRRTVVIYVERGENDIEWYRDHSRAVLNLALRTIGDRVLAALWAVEEETQAQALLAECDAAGFHLIGQAMDRLAPGWSTSDDQFRGVVEAAGAYVGGLRLVADAAGVEFSTLAAVVVEPLARSLVRQWEAMRDVQEATDNLGTAVGEIVGRALVDQRAHVRDRENVATPIVPGQTVQAHGLRELLNRDGFPAGWDGRGVSLYWLPDDQAVGVRAKELHGLLAGYRDPRTDGYTARSLPDALLRVGAILRNDKTGPNATHQQWIGGGIGKTRLVLLRPELVWDLPETDQAAPLAVPDQPAPEPAGPVDGDQGAGQLDGDQGDVADYVQPELPEPAPEAGPCAQCLTPGGFCGFGGTVDESAPCVLCGIPTKVRSLCGAPRTGNCRPASAAQEPDTAPAAPAPSVAPATPDQPVRERSAAPVSTPADELAAFARVIRKPASEGGWPDATDADLIEAYRLFQEASEGVRMIGDPGFVGVQWYRWIRDRNSSASRAALARAAEGEQPDALRSELVDAVTYGGNLFRFADHIRPDAELAEGGHLVALDVNGAYLAAAASVELGDREPAHYTSTRAIRKVTSLPKWSKSPGYVQLGSVPEFAVPMPALADLAPGSWIATPWIDFLMSPWAGRDSLIVGELDITELIYWHKQDGAGRAGHGRRLSAWQGHARDTRTALADAPGLSGEYARRVSKAIYTGFLGGYMRSEKFNRTELLRPDWSDMVVSQTGANLMRKVARATVEGGAPLPIGVYRDDVWYAAESVPNGMTEHIGDQLGKLKVKGILPVTDAMIDAVNSGSAYAMSTAIAAAVREGN